MNQTLAFSVPEFISLDLSVSERRPRSCVSCGSALSARPVALLLFLHLSPFRLDIISHFDSMEGVIDGGAVGPAPGPG